MMQHNINPPTDRPINRTRARNQVNHQLEQTADFTKPQQQDPLPVALRPKVRFHSVRLDAQVDSRADLDALYNRFQETVVVRPQVVHDELGLGIGCAAQSRTFLTLAVVDESEHGALEDADHPVRDGRDAHKVEVHT